MTTPYLMRAEINGEILCATSVSECDVVAFYECWDDLAAQLDSSRHATCGAIAYMVDDGRGFLGRNSSILVRTRHDQWECRPFPQTITG